MSVVVASYSESNYTAEYGLFTSNHGAGQSFIGNGYKLNYTTFYLYSTGSPAGNAVAKIYTGVNIPTTLVATSDAILASSISSSYSLVNFTYSGAQQIILTKGTKYYSVVEYTSGDGFNGLSFGMDDTSPTDPGTLCTLSVGTPDHWVTHGTTQDAIYYVYGDMLPTANFFPFFFT